MNTKTVQLAGTASLLVLTSFTAHAKLSAKSYISNGLIGHWDGIENVAYGQAHNGDATQWKELTGKISGYFNTGSVTAWSFQNPKGLDTTNDQYCRYNGADVNQFKSAYLPGHYTVEIAYNKDSETKTVKFLGLGYSCYYVGFYSSKGIGFSGNNFMGTRLWPAFAVKPETVAGQHTFSCRQNVSTAKIDFDGTTFGEKSDITPSEGVSVNQTYLLGLGNDHEEKSGANNNIFGLDGTYYSIRFYDRALTDDEVAVNRAVDQVRYFDKDPDEIALPDGWRFAGEGDDLALERRLGGLTVNDSNGGTASVVGSETAEFWVESPNDSMTVTMTATPATGYKFYGWRGIASAEGDPKALTVTAVVTGNVKAVFYKTGPHALSAKSYILDDLIGHWDGIENVAYGQSHSGDATQWKELTGKIGGYFSTGSVTDWSFQNPKGLDTTNDKYCRYSGANVDLYKTAYVPGRYTVEIAYNKVSSDVRVKFLGLGYSCYYVGFDKSKGIGFSGNDFGGTRLWPSFVVSPATVAGQHTFSCRQDVSTATIDFDGTTFGVKDNITPSGEVSVKPSYLFSLGNDYDEKIGANNNIYGLDGTYHSIRFYGRPLTAEEIAVNRAVDQVRFFDQDPATCTLPNGWRFNTAEGIALEQKFAVTSADATMGLVSVGDGEPAASADCWVEKAVPTMVKLTAVPAKDYKFVRWEGAITGDDLKAATGTFAVSGNVTAVFKKVSGLSLIVQ